MYLGVALVVEQLLPLPDHAEEAVVEDQHLDRQALDRAGSELLRGHLEAAVAVDRHDQLTWPANLGAHGGGYGEAHRSCAARVDPAAGPGEAVVLRCVHLVLTDPGLFFLMIRRPRRYTLFPFPT